MKDIVKHETKLGSDGKLKAAFGADETDLIVQVEARYPHALLIEPGIKALESALDKLEKAIPGDWDKPLIEKIKAEAREEIREQIAKYISAQQEPEPQNMPAAQDANETQA